MGGGGGGVFVKAVRVSVSNEYIVEYNFEVLNGYFEEIVRLRTGQRSGRKVDGM